jgi:hypothetical protein
MLPIERFSKNRSHADGHESSCKECRRASIKVWQQNNVDKCNRYRDKHDEHYLFAYAAIANKKQSRRFVVELTVDELTDKALKTVTCPICGTTLDYSLHKGAIHDDSPSLDRKDNGMTITNDNSWVICHQCNRSKSNRSLDEFVAYMENALRRLRS